MSTENIVEKKKLPGGKLLVTFETRDNKLRTYSYGQVAARRIKAGADPANYKGKEQ